MVDPVTVNRGYAIPTRGSDVGTWDTPINGDFNLIDQNLGALSTVSLTNANVTLTSDQYACGTIRLTGVLTGNVAVIFPTVQAWWTIDNQTTGAFVATISIGSGQVIAVEQGAAADILIDGTNVKFRNLPPVGTYLDVCDAALPAWIAACTVPPYLNCDGTTFNATTYPYLNTKLGGNTLPDIRGGSRASLNQGTSRITTAGSGIDGNTRFSRGGNELSQAHTHAVNGNTGGESQGHVHGGVLTSFTQSGVAAGGSFLAVQAISAGVSGAQSQDHTHGISLTSAAFGSGASQNMPPMTISGITLIRAA